MAGRAKSRSVKSRGKSKAFTDTAEFGDFVKRSALQETLNEILQAEGKYTRIKKVEQHY